MLRIIPCLFAAFLAFSAPAAATPAPASGVTEIYLTSAGTLTVGLGLDITPLGPIEIFEPPTLPVPSPFLFIPITGFDAMEAQVLHEGVGLDFASGGDSVLLENFIVDRDDLVILADVSINGGLAASDAPVFDLVDCAIGGGCLGLNGVLSLDGLGLELSSTAAGVFSDIFEFGDLTGTPIGVANVHLLLSAPEPGALLLSLSGLTGLGLFGRRRR